MRLSLRAVPVVLAVVITVGCATTGFVSTWRNPEAVPVQPQGEKVAAVVMAKNESTRRAAEDVLAKAISAQGAQGIPMYTITMDTNEAVAKAALEKAGFGGVVVMRPTGSRQEITSTATMYGGPYYGGYWGGYYGYGWGSPWGGMDIQTNTLVNVETLVYSLKQNKLIWAGQSTTTNPSNVDSFVKEVATAAARELRKEKLIGKP